MNLNYNPWKIKFSSSSSSSSSIHPNCILQPNHTDTDKAVTILLLFFALDDINYARWLSVYLCDMCQHGPPISVSSLLQWWMCCAQAHDQAHEQCNALVKGNGGAVGFASNPGALRQEVTAGPQIARLLKSFKHSMTSKSADCMDRHEQSHAPQKAFS